MQSVILITDSATQKEQVIAYIKKYNISAVDTFFVSEEDKNSIGVSAIRELQKTLYISPVKSRYKVVIFLNAHLLTIEAQTSLLKLLEEPADFLLLILSTPKKNALIPTILSRCLIIDVSHPVQTYPEADANEEFTLLQKSSIGDRLKIAQDLSKDQNKTTVWLERMIRILINMSADSKGLHSQPTNTYLLQIIQAFIKTYTIIISTNVSIRFCLEALLLQI